MTGHDVRQRCRDGRLTTPTPGLAPGYVQANLVCVPRDVAFDFLLFCRRNPRPCPLLDVTDPGDPVPRHAAPDGDVRTDCPRYRVYRHGELVEEPADLLAHWRGDLVGFLLGCSFTFEKALLDAGLPVRHVEEGRNVPMYRTAVPCAPAGLFRGPLVVSMRPMTPAQAEEAARVCAGFPLAHGAPVHVGDPAGLGIGDLGRPDFGDAVTVRPGEVPVFWACGVTPQAVAMTARPPLLLTHAPGHMMLTDLRDADMAGR
ncbi:MAG: putative hydro-lyase [Gemmataceae bacterium]